jgi:hypothetical protein
MSSSAGPTCSDGYDKCFAGILFLEKCVGLKFHGCLGDDFFEDGFQGFMIKFSCGCFRFSGENVFGQVCVLGNSVVGGLICELHSENSGIKRTISSLPSMRAIRPPVLVPQIRSNTSQGWIADTGSLGWSTRC